MSTVKAIRRVFSRYAVDPTPLSDVDDVPLTRNTHVTEEQFNRIFGSTDDPQSHVRDLCALRGAVHDLTEYVTTKIFDPNHQTDETILDEVLPVLQDLYHDSLSFSPENPMPYGRLYGDSLTFAPNDQLSHSRQVQIYHILRIKLLLMQSAEQYLVNKEVHDMSTADLKFSATASRYERAKNRGDFNTVVADLKSAQLRRTFVLPRLETPVGYKGRPYNDSDHDDCAICSDGFQDQDPPAVTHNCCNRPWHVHCLLTWLMSAENMTCPMCRSELDDAEFLSELLEMGVQQLDSL